MARYKMVGNNRIELNSEELAEVTTRETEWANAAPARALAELRDKRNKLLQAYDWEILQELEKGNAISSDMRTYRQALRDLPNGKDTVDKCNNATWPTKP